MRYSTFIPLFATLFAILPSAAAELPVVALPTAVESTEQNITARTFGVDFSFGWDFDFGFGKGKNWHKCANVAGDWNGYKYNFGCLCLDDVDDFCDNNNINGYVKALINSYVYNYGNLNQYPDNAQPTCDGNGGWNCGSLSKKGNGCAATACPAHLCSTNGGCCPRGQTYQNGQCCGRVGCSKSGQTCSPAYQCPSGSTESNGVCCPSGQTGFESKYCCPAGQTGSGGGCKCPAGTTKNGDKCDSLCVTSQKWCNTKCCPKGASEDPKTKLCVCDSDQEKLSGSGDKAQCVDRCTSSTFTWYKSTCCPVGATETSAGQCQCTSPQQELRGTGDSSYCANRCATGTTYSIDKCCPTGSAQLIKAGDCVCSDVTKKLAVVNGVSQCVAKCTDSNKPKWCKSKCCKSYLDEDSKGNCACSDDAFYDNGRNCAPKCAADEKYNYVTKGCESICDEDAGYVYQLGWKNNGMCCKQGQTACNNVCCPAGKEEIGNTGICCKKGSRVEGKTCIEPTGGSTNHRRALSGRIFDGSQMVVPATAQTYGLEANKDGKLCPAQMAACPIDGRSGDFECLDSRSDLQSCGGCVSMGQGEDCTQIKGARWMGCNEGQCEVYSCKKGWTRSSDGRKCVLNQKK